jgi:hypothetical protein
MKNIHYILVYLISQTIFSQSNFEINKQLGIPDSLSYTKELRIYISDSFDKESELWRLYKNDMEWVIETHRYFESPKTYQIVEYDEESKQKDSIGLTVHKPTKIRIPTPDDMELKWLKLLATKILEMPKIEEIEWKFNEPMIEYVDGKYVMTQLIHLPPNDGVTYKIQIRNDGTFNQILISNPDFYFETYPHLDEIEYLRNFFEIIQGIFIKN